MTKQGLTIVLLFLALTGLGCNSRSASSPSPERGTGSANQANKDEIALPIAQQNTAGIQTEAVTLSEAPDILRLAGRISLADDRNWHVGVRTEGLVVAVYVGLGDHVRKGQVLARYHADEVREARAQYRKATAELARAQAAESLAQRNYDRARTLLSLKASSVQQVEQAQQDLLAAQMGVRVAQVEVDRGRDLLEDDLRVPADPPLTQHDESSDDVPIFAPASGYVIEKHVTPGKTIQTSTETFVIGDLSQVWMLASVRPEKLSFLRLGQSATVTLPGIPGQRFSGKITNLSEEFDPATRVMQARIVLQNSGNLLRPEMLANAEIPIDSRKPAIQIISDAVQQINGQDAVFVRTAPDRFAVHLVRVGEAVNGKTPVLEGLKPGEQVVVRGSFILKSQLLRSSMEGD